jgi:transcriptional regulator with XRE-family HTH domain
VLAEFITMSSYRQQVAGNVRAEMARVQMTQKTLGARLGISQPALSRRLTGEQAFDTDELLKVAEILGVAIGVLYGATSVNGIGPCSSAVTRQSPPKTPMPARGMAGSERNEHVLDLRQPADEMVMNGVIGQVVRGVAA